MNPRIDIPIACLIVGLTVGFYFGFQQNKPKQIIESYKPEVRQSDNSLVLERKPDASAKPKQVLPPQAKVERIVSVEVETEKPVDHIGVDFTVVSEPDGSKRVIASSPDGRVVGGADIPVAPISIPVVQNWAVGGLYNPHLKKYGGFIQYKKGPYVAQVIAMGDNLSVGVGITF